MNTLPSEAGLTSVQQFANQHRKAAGVGELLKVDMDKLGDKIKDKLKWQTSLRWMVYELANREKVSEGCRQVGVRIDAFLFFFFFGNNKMPTPNAHEMFSTSASHRVSHV